MLGLSDWLEGESPRTFDATFPGGAGRWEVRSGTFRQDGLPHQLLVISDLSRVLRAEERSAWQRLVRVLGHEINNSLAPIKSIAGSLRNLAARPARPADWENDLRSGLEVIEGRSEALGRFMGAYARLARLPQPRRGTVDVATWMRRVAALETRLEVQVKAGPAVSVTADGDQLDQLLINLVRNGGRRGAGDGRWRRGRLAHHRGRAGGDGGGRRTGSPRSRQPVRPLLHHQGERFGHRPGAQPADRRGARRRAGAGAEAAASRRARLSPAATG